MTNFFKTNGNQKLLLEPSSEDDYSSAFSVDDPLEEYSQGSAPRTDRHIVRSASNSTDHYHGPCTLLALCNEFCDTLLPVPRSQDANTAQDDPQEVMDSTGPAVNSAVKDLLNLIRLEAGNEESLDLQSDPVPIRLPLKQFLLMAQTQFFQQADYATDIFVQSQFASNVERVYAKPFTSTDEAWAICFNTIILLVLGPESSNHGCDSLTGSQLLRPFLMTVRSAMDNPRILMAAKIENVQALTLLVSAQITDPQASRPR